MTKVTLLAGTKFWSTMSLKSSNFWTNCSGDFINFKQDFHSQDLGFLFLSISIASGKKPANKNTVAENTESTPEGGVAKDFAV